MAGIVGGLKGLTGYSDIIHQISKNLQSFLPHDPSILTRQTNLHSPFSSLFQPNGALRQLSSVHPNFGTLFNPSSRPIHNYGSFNASSSGSFPKSYGIFNPPAHSGSSMVAPDKPTTTAPTGTQGTQQYMQIMQQVQSESGVPWQVLASIMGIESQGQNLGANGSGAVGLMQVVGKYWQDTANKYGGNLSDPYTNIRTAADILLQNYNTYGSWEKAAAAYFGGDGAFNSDGSYSTASDSFGTNISNYVDAFNNNMDSFGYGTPSPSEQQNGGQPANPTAGSALSAAMTAQGTPYIFGGAEPGGFDCSGLVTWAYAQAGKYLPHNSQQQYNATQRISSADLMPGDLIFFTGTANNGQVVTHVGIYIGNGQMLQAPKEGDVVKVTSLNTDYWQSHLYGYGRVV